MIFWNNCNTGNAIKKYPWFVDDQVPKPTKSRAVWCPLCWFARAAIIKCQKLGNLNNRNLPSLCSGGWKSKTQELARKWPRWYNNLHRHLTYRKEMWNCVHEKKLQTRNKAFKWPILCYQGLNFFLAGLLTITLTPDSPTNSQQLKWPSFSSTETTVLRNIWWRETTFFFLNLKVKCHHVTPWHYCFDELLFASKILKRASKAPHNRLLPTSLASSHSPLTPW